jgi:regulator of protease activity HflC (stomatin/prohibitin superfamily)
MFFFHKVTIFEGYAGLHFYRGKLAAILSPGRYRFFGSDNSVSTIDLRPVGEIIGGQEVTTQDGASLKASMVVYFQVQDPALYYRACIGQVASGYAGRAAYSQAGASTKLHHATQVGIREWVMSRAVREALDQRSSMAQDVIPAVEKAATDIGIRVVSFDLLDLSVTGGLKAAFSDLLKTQIEGEAALARARNEGATMRSLLNTARLVREHPGLLELRVLSSGQKPRVTFMVGNESRSAAGISDSNAEED